MNLMFISFEKELPLIMKIENSNHLLNFQKNKKAEVKEDKSTISVDNFVSARETEPWLQAPYYPEKPINGVKDYFKNLGTSIKNGVDLGAIKTENLLFGEPEEMTEEEFEELKANEENENPVKIILTGLPVAAAEYMGGIMGACVGTAMGLVGKNAGKYIKREDMLA